MQHMRFRLVAAGPQRLVDPRQLWLARFVETRSVWGRAASAAHSFPAAALQW